MTRSDRRAHPDVGGGPGPGKGVVGMKRVLMPVLLLPLLAACSETPLDVPAAAVGRGTPSFSAAPITDVLKVPFGTLQWVDCANGGQGEIVSVDGVVQTVNHSVTDASGGVHNTVAIVGIRAEGEGQATHHQYRATGTGLHIVSNARGDGDHYHAFTHINFVGHGSVEDFGLDVEIRSFTDANGRPVVTVSAESLRCN